MHVAGSPIEISRQRPRAWGGAWFPSELVTLGVLTLATLVVAWDRLHLDRQVSSVDNSTLYLPMFAHLGARLRDGDLPMWLPSVFSGAPFTGDAQSGWMYLPAMVLYFALPALAAFKMFILVHMLIAGFSTYGLSRLLGLGQIGSLAAALAFEFGPFLKYTICCNIFMQVATWVPLSLLGIELAVRSQNWLGRGGGWVVAGFALSQELAGWIGQGAYYGLLAAGGFLAFRTLIAPGFRDRSPSRRFQDFGLHIIGVYGFALGLAAAGVLPRLDAISRSSRAGGTTVTNSGEFSGWTLSQTIMRLLDIRIGQGRWYLGGAVLALAIVAPLVSRRSSVFYFAGFSIVTVILALDRTPVHDPFFLLPKFFVLHEHVPSRVLMVVWIGPSFLAGATIDALVQKSTNPRRMIAGAIGGIAILIGGYLATRHFDLEIGRPAIRATTLTAGLVLVAASLKSHWIVDRVRFSKFALPAILAFLLALVVWDGAGRAFGQIKDGDTPPAMNVAADNTPSSGAAEFLQSRQKTEPPFRFFGYDPGNFSASKWNGGYRYEFRDPAIQALLVNDRAMILGLEDVQGYDPVQVNRYVEFISALNGLDQEYHELNVLPSGLDSPMLNILNARYIIVPASIPPGRPDLLHLSQRYPTVYADDQVRVLENDAALPRAWIVRDAQEAEGDLTLKLLSQGTVDPARTVLLEKTPPVVSAPTDPSADRVTVVENAGDSVRLAATASSPGMIVMSDVYDPDWKAYVDGKKVPLYVADHAFRAIPLAAGTHSVELRYEPLSLRVGLVISLAFALLTFAIAIALARRAFRGQMVESTQ
jgi:Bacterial membrane protein YfhO